MRTADLSLAACVCALAFVAACGREATTKNPVSTSGASANTTPSATAAPTPEGASPTTGAAASPGTLTVAPAAGELAVGKPAPDFSATAQDGTKVHLADLKGKNVVLYFYPKDETPGCTKEACAFRDGFTDLQKKGVVLIGASSDTDASHKAFAEHHKLPFLLVSDPKGELATAYGVPMTAGYIGRQTFVIGPDGALKKIYRKVDVTVHAQEIAADVK